MADFLYLFHGGRPEDAGYSPDEIQKHMQKWGAWIENLGKQGLFKGGAPLDTQARVLRQAVVTDGPYAETKDAVGGYVIVSAETLDEAAHMARECPIFETNGTVEVRAIRKM